MTRRIDRVNELLRAEISELMQRSLKDPRIAGIVSITRVECSADLKLARVYVSVLGTEAERDGALDGLRAATGFLRRELRSRLDLRSIPELVFRRDDSIEKGTRVLELLREVNPD